MILDPDSRPISATVKPPPVDALVRGSAGAVKGAGRGIRRFFFGKAWRQNLKKHSDEEAANLKWADEIDAEIRELRRVGAPESRAKDKALRDFKRLAERMAKEAHESWKATFFRPFWLFGLVAAAALTVFVVMRHNSNPPKQKRMTPEEQWLDDLRRRSR